jgi:pimeloyl-ACP methyl ester carboxylesterase
MANFVLLHGGGSDAWYWHRVVPLLETKGHDVVAPDLPCDDDSAGLTDYVEAVVDAVGHRTDLIVVAQSLAGFIAPLLCGRLPVRLIVMLAAMVPAPGETGGDWWANTGHDPMLFEQDEEAMFLHDVPPAVAAESAHHVRPQSDAAFKAPWPLPAWPDVPTRFLLCRDDRLFPADFQRRVVRERLGIVPDEMEGSHCPALSRPDDLVERLEAYRAEL